MLFINYVRWHFIVIIAIIFWGFCINPINANAQSLIIDQSNDGFIPGDFGTAWIAIQNNGPLGQTFTPTLSYLDYVELYTKDTKSSIDPGTVGAELFVNIRKNSITGSIIGTSSTITLANDFGGITHFDFHTPLSLIPGDNYVIEVNASGDLWTVGDIGSLFTDSYPDGQAIVKGQFSSLGYSDLWFREGISVVPEPISSVLFLTGGAILIGRKYIRRKKTEV